MLLLFLLLQTAASQAGQVTRLVAPANIVHQDGKQEALETHTPFSPGESLVTGEGGRIRAQLNEGSIFTLGSKTNLKVVAHDAQAQQTRLELGAGKVRIEPIRHTKAAQVFEIRTNLATVTFDSASGDAVVDASDPSKTVVFSGGGGLTVRGSGSSAHLARGQMTIVTSADPVLPKPTPLPRP